jgi:N-carbamoyl-L-amino-acid hydrolase
MIMRMDALTGAAQIILELESLCRETYAEPVVGTVGKMIVEPNASNVIPGRVVFDLEVRSVNTDILELIIVKLQENSLEIADARRLNVSFDCLSKTEPILVTSEVQNVLRESCQATAATISLPSGAGHDANQLARITPIGMIFVPSKDGRSHCPEEWTSYEDVALGVEALTRAILLFDEME